jgi:hypothetical protein
MLGLRSAQGGLFEADHLYLDYVGRDTFYGFLASQRGQLFRDEEFAELYCPDNGRNSVPPSLKGFYWAKEKIRELYRRQTREEADKILDNIIFNLRWADDCGHRVG